MQQKIQNQSSSPAVFWNRNTVMKGMRCWQWKLVSTGCFSFTPLISESQEVFVQPCVQTESLWYSDKAPSWSWQVSTLKLIIKQDRFDFSHGYYWKVFTCLKHWTCFKWRLIVCSFYISFDTEPSCALKYNEQMNSWLQDLKCVQYDTRFLIVVSFEEMWVHSFTILCFESTLIFGTSSIIGQ